MTHHFLGVRPCGPVGAARENRFGRSFSVHIHHELVMSDVARGHVTADEPTLDVRAAGDCCSDLGCCGLILSVVLITA